MIRHPKLQEQNALEAKKVQDEEMRQKSFFAHVCNSGEGVEALRKIFDICGYDGWLVGIDPVTGEINKKTTLHNAAIRTVWAQIRKLLPVKALVEIEITGPNRKKEIANGTDSGNPV